MEISPSPVKIAGYSQLWNNGDKIQENFRGIEVFEADHLVTEKKSRKKEHPGFAFSTRLDKVEEKLDDILGKIDGQFLSDITKQNIRDCLKSQI